MCNQICGYVCVCASVQKNAYERGAIKEKELRCIKRWELSKCNSMKWWRAVVSWGSMQAKVCVNRNKATIALPAGIGKSTEGCYVNEIVGGGESGDDAYIVNMLTSTYTYLYNYTNLIGCAWWACKMMRFSATVCNGVMAIQRVAQIKTKK